jgi:hypothetical protein
VKKNIKKEEQSSTTLDKFNFKNTLNGGVGPKFVI